jgi:tetratricopeptide (TPR) repeat protein
VHAAGVDKDKVFASPPGALQEIYDQLYGLQTDWSKPIGNDTGRIINQSLNLLYNREPKITAGEYALYERITGLIATKPDKAISVLEELTQKKERSTPAFSLMLGTLYYSAGKVAKAEEVFRDATVRAPEFLRAWGDLGYLYYNQNNFAEAASCFSKAVSLGDRDPQTFGCLGYSLERLKNPVGAEAAYLAALTGDMGKPVWVEGLLRLYIHTGQYLRAEGAVRQLLDTTLTEKRYWDYYTLILLNAHRRLDALAILELAQSLGVTDNDRLLMLGDLYTELGFPTEAIGVYEKLAARDKSLGIERLLRYARVLITQKRLVPARTCLALATPLVEQSGSVSLHMALADLALAEDNLPTAREHLEALLKKQPFDGQALLSLGRVQVRQERSEEAICTFTLALEVKEVAYPAFVELANLELSKGHYPQSLGYAIHAQHLQYSADLEQFIGRLSTLIEVQRSRSQ